MKTEHVKGHSPAALPDVETMEVELDPLVIRSLRVVKQTVKIPVPVLDIQRKETTEFVPVKKETIEYVPCQEPTVQFVVHEEDTTKYNVHEEDTVKYNVVVEDLTVPNVAAMGTAIAALKQQLSNSLAEFREALQQEVKQAVREAREVITGMIAELSGAVKSDMEEIKFQCMEKMNEVAAAIPEKIQMPKVEEVPYLVDVPKLNYVPKTVETVTVNETVKDVISARIIPKDYEVIGQIREVKKFSQGV